MAKILSPNKQYTGVSASVSFANGVGETDKLHLIEWFVAHGYTVEADDEQTADDDKAAAEKAAAEREAAEKEAAEKATAEHKTDEQAAAKQKK